MMAVGEAVAEWHLGGLLADFASVSADEDRPVRGLALDSRRLSTGDLFLACQGTHHHGLQFVDQAMEAGAAAVAWEPPASDEALTQARQRLAAQDVPLIRVERLGARAGLIADRFYHQPSARLWMVGVTGTDGKTSTTHFLAQALTALGRRCGVIGTLGHGLYEDLRAGDHTTPDPITLQAELAALYRAGADAVAMEVSSHALAQDRVAGTAYNVAVLTNLSRDHLDYHTDEDEYAAAKERLFGWPGLQAAVVNYDDALGRRVAAGLDPAVRAVGYALVEGDGQEPAEGRAEVVGHGLQLDSEGLRLVVRTPGGEGTLRTGLVGRFNAYNLLAALGALLAGDIPLDRALQALGGVRTIPGRMERFGGGPQGPLVVVDYAHTPRSLEQALNALRPHAAGRVWCVFGCGGDRDPGKRPQMGAVAERLADQVVLTNDNPRWEPADGILDDILGGIAQPERVNLCPDRGEALEQTLAAAGSGDVVLVAGKGHETFQEARGERIAFSDRERVRAWCARQQ